MPAPVSALAERTADDQLRLRARWKCSVLEKAAAERVAAATFWPSALLTTTRSASSVIPRLMTWGGRRRRRGGILSILAAIAGGRSALGCNLLLPQPSPTSTAAAWPGCHPCGCLSLAAKGAALPIATYRVEKCWPASFTPAARRPPAAAPQAPRSPRGRPLLSRSAPRPAAQCGAMSD